MVIKLTVHEMCKKYSLYTDDSALPPTQISKVHVQLDYLVYSALELGLQATSKQIAQLEEEFYLLSERVSYSRYSTVDASG